MSTHRSTDPWRKNVFTPRSRHEAFGESEYLSPVDYGELSKAEKQVNNRNYQLGTYEKRIEE
jgi:hypothetical protein